jgi:hypothetical protein
MAQRANRRVQVTIHRNVLAGHTDVGAGMHSRKMPVKKSSTQCGREMSEREHFQKAWVIE